MIREHLIEFDELEHLFEEVLPEAPKADIAPQEFRAYFEELRRQVAKS